jgi:hypothetical protein
MAKKVEGKSKVDMVYEAIQKHGWDAPIDDLATYIMGTFGVEMSKAHISQTKSNLKKKHGIKVRKRRRRGAAGEPVDTVVGTGVAKLTDILAFVTAVQQWEQKIGSDNIRDVVKTVLKK